VNVQLAQNDLGPSPKILNFVVCISINPYLDYYFSKFAANHMTYWSLGYFEWNDAILVLLRHNCLKIRGI